MIRLRVPRTESEITPVRLTASYPQHSSGRRRMHLWTQRPRFAQRRASSGIGCGGIDGGHGGLQPVDLSIWIDGVVRIRGSHAKVLWSWSLMATTNILVALLKTMRDSPGCPAGFHPRRVRLRTRSSRVSS